MFSRLYKHLPSALNYRRAFSTLYRENYYIFFSFNFTPLNFILCLLYKVSILSTFPYLQKLLFLIRRGLWNDLFDAVRKTLSWDSQKPQEKFYFKRISSYYIRSTSNVQTHIYSKYTLMLLLLYIS